MERYERLVGIKTIYLTLIRRTESILAIFLPMFLASFVVTQYVLPKEYTSTSIISNNAGISQQSYDLIKRDMTTDEIYAAVASNLAIGGVSHANGKEITVKDISSGIVFSAYTSNMTSFSVSFKSSDVIIVKETLIEYASFAIATVSGTYTGLKVYSPAGNAYKSSGENKYFLIGAAASLVLALGVPFIYEIAADQVFDSGDIENMGVPGFEIRASGKKKEAK